MIDCVNNVLVLVKKTMVTVKLSKQRKNCTGIDENTMVTSNFSIQRKHCTGINEKDYGDYQTLYKKKKLNWY